MGNEYENMHTMFASKYLAKILNQYYTLHSDYRNLAQIRYTQESYHHFEM